MEYIGLFVVSFVAFVELVLIYLLYNELGNKDKLVDDLLIENRALASKLLRKETKKAMANRKNQPQPKEVPND